jgi:hypothetical protein
MSEGSKMPFAEFRSPATASVGVVAGSTVSDAAELAHVDASSGDDESAPASLGEEDDDELELQAEPIAKTAKK